MKQLSALSAHSAVPAWRRWRSLSSVAGMKLWPPKPGLTDISNTMSTLSNTYSR